MRCIQLHVAVAACIIPISSLAFQPRKVLRRRPEQILPRCPSYSTNHLCLLPISRFRDDFAFLSESKEYRCCLDEKGCFFAGDKVYELGLVEEEDLPDLAQFVVSAFGADAIRLSQDLSSIERLVMSPVAEFLNAYSGLVAYAEVLSGTKQRAEHRLKNINILPPKLEGLTREQMISVSEKSSLILALVRRKDEGNAKVDIIASIELRLQVRNPASCDFELVIR